MLVLGKAYLSPEVEKVCFKFFKQVIGVHRSTTSIAVLSEFGRFSCQIICIINIVKDWHRISLMDKDSLLYNTCKSQLEIIESNNDGHNLCLHSGLHFVREILGGRDLHMSRYGDVPLFWVLFWGCSWITGYLFGLFPDFWVSFFW